MEGFADKKAENLLNAIQTSKSQPLSRLINALGIHGVGEVMAVELAHNYEDLEKLSRASIEELQEIEGVGPNIAMGIVDWFKRDSNKRVLKKLKNAGVWPIEKTIIGQDNIRKRFSDLTFVITGTLEGFSRDVVKEIIHENGGKVSDSVSKNTSYLLVGDQPGSKLDKAKQLGVEIIGMDEFNRLLTK